MRLTILFVLFPGIALFAQAPSPFENHLSTGETALQQSRYTLADTELRAALAEAARPGQSVPVARVAEANSVLCDLDLMMNRFDEAITLAKTALGLLDGPAVQALQTDLAPPDLSPALIRLAGAYRAAGMTNLAYPLLERAIAIDRKLGADDPKVSADYDKLGSAYMELGIIDDAHAAYRRALDTRISHLGPDHLEVATSWVNLGVLEERSENSGEAQQDFETALAISEKNLGPESYGVTGILDRLGKLFSDQKKYGDAEPVFQRSLAIREKVLGSRHSDVAPALENLAMVYYFDRKYAEAEPLFQRALQIWKQTQGEASPLVAQALDNLGALYVAQKRYNDAEPFFRKALSIRESKDIDTLSNMAVLYEAVNDARRADDFFQRAILIGDKGLGADHPEVIGTMDAYAQVLRSAGRVADARKIEARAKELKDKLTPQVTAGAVAATGATGGPPPPPVRKK